MIFYVPEKDAIIVMERWWGGHIGYRGPDIGDTTDFTTWEFLGVL